ncbi:hypothetical protein [Pacificibacter marinus]|uniref:hypothetical protein n=1 Tax=Pacificibacter marinus TaxID=658057 RepID=UPI001C06AA9B|nr:hypothetical protein [Pacificibacter marinus]
MVHNVYSYLVPFENRSAQWQQTVAPIVYSLKSALMLQVHIWNDSFVQNRILPFATVVAVDGLFGALKLILKPQGDKGQKLSARSAKADVENKRYLAKNTQIFDTRIVKNPPDVAVPAQDAAHPEGIVN